MKRHAVSLRPASRIPLSGRRPSIDGLDGRRWQCHRSASRLAVTVATTVCLCLGVLLGGLVGCGGGGSSAAPAQATLTSISVSPTSATVNVGATQQFSATGNYSDGSTKDLTSSSTWTSSDTTKVTIESAGQQSPGLASGVAAGSATITAASASQSGSSSVTVKAATSSGIPLPNEPHGMFVFNPPTSGSDFTAVQDYLITGTGSKYVKGADFIVQWAAIEPSNGTFDFSTVDSDIAVWTAAGKQVELSVIATSYGDKNSNTPKWYLTGNAIQSVSEAMSGGNNVITLTTASPMDFVTGNEVGQQIQLVGTNTLPHAIDGTYTICDHSTSGCADPTATTLTALSTVSANVGSSCAASCTGTAGNPVYGNFKSNECGSGTIPVEWGQNFINTWQSVLSAVVAHYASNPGVVVLQTGFGIGFENNPSENSNGSECQAEITETSPTPLSGQTPIYSVQNWISYVTNMAGFVKTLNSQKKFKLALNLTDYTMGQEDWSTPDAEAAAYAADGLAFGSDGWQESDVSRYEAGDQCLGGDWCAMFDKFKGQVFLFLQPVTMSDPTGSGSTTGQTESLAPSIPFALQRGAQLLEIYYQDWLCTFDPTWMDTTDNNTYNECSASGYPSAFQSAASTIN
jgi:hypothetical protein